jgi:ketosteroid isomerase-like protein
MSQENVEIVRRGFDAFDRGDLEGVLDLLGPEFEFHTAQLFSDTDSVYRADSPTGVRPSKPPGCRSS